MQFLLNLLYKFISFLLAPIGALFQIGFLHDLSLSIVHYAAILNHYVPIDTLATVGGSLLLVSLVLMGISAFFQLF